MSAIGEGRSLELYFIDGRPDGMLTAEVFNWTGHVLMAPRTQITAALARKEARYTGVYLLLGEKDGRRCAYIGEGEDISDRIRNHDTRKDWWTKAILVTSAGNKLNKAHVKYLEARLAEEAHNARQYELDNGSTPTRSSLSEAAQSEMEVFLRYLFLVLPALRIDMFERGTRPASPPVPAPGEPVTPRFELINKKHGLTATAVLTNGEFVVEAGSLTRGSWEGRGGWDSGYSRLHEELRRTGVLQPQDGRCVFIQNYAFTSPSAAAAVVNGRPSNGNVEWKLKGSVGVTYKDWEASQLARQEGT